MKYSSFTLESKYAQRDFDVEVYGSGVPVIVFPEGDSSCTSWDNGGMIDALSSLLRGKVQLFCVDSSDDLGWYAATSSTEYRTEGVANYYRFVEEELVPFVNEQSDSSVQPYLCGCGIGALNAAVEMLRRPDLFGGALAMSGSYDMSAFSGYAFDSSWAQFSPSEIIDWIDVDSLAGHPMCFVCGQSDSEGGLASQRELERRFGEKGIEATFEYWGADVTHDWTWWQEMAKQLLPCVVTKNGLVDRQLTIRASLAKASADRAAAELDRRRSEVGAANAELKRAKAAVKETAKRLAAETEVTEERAEASRVAAEAAAAAWAERDNAAAILAAAEDRAREIQGAANVAAASYDRAEWIRGEAEAAAAAAVDAVRAAEERVAAGKEAVKAATATSKSVAREYDRVKKEIEDEAAAQAATAEQ